ncbi:hypothetical protein G9A89_007682 [Geosiphon pyriformis]|nr:hypothetical protein G9A89_007682 [Geosiphon pyriformis]
MVSVPISVKSDELPVSGIKKFEEAMKPDQNRTIVEKSKTVAKLQNDLKCIPTVFKEHPVGNIAISTKAHLPNDIQALDQET